MDDLVFLEASLIDSRKIKARKISLAELVEKIVVPAVDEITARCGVGNVVGRAKGGGRIGDFAGAEQDFQILAVIVIEFIRPP